MIAVLLSYALGKFLTTLPIHIAWQALATKATNFALVLERVMIGYFLDIHDTVPKLNKKR